MAQKTTVQLVDDIDGSEAAETVSFGVDGASFEIDLSEEHASSLREALSRFIVSARRAGQHAGRAASYVLTLGYAGFLIGPSLVGIGGELLGLRVALAVVPVAAACIAIASRTSVVRA